MTEQWRPIAGYEDYEVSDQGRVRSLTYRGKQGRYQRAEPLVLKICAGQHRYPTVCLSKDNKRLTHDVHRLVLTTFDRPPELGEEAAHLNGDKADPRLVNLAWVSHSENERHKRLHGTVGAGTASSSRLTRLEVQIIRQRAEAGIAAKRLAQEFGIHRSTVGDIINRRTWSHV